LYHAQVERRDNDLIISFAIQPNATVKVAEGPFGLDFLISGNTD